MHWRSGPDCSQGIGPIVHFGAAIARASQSVEKQGAAGSRYPDSRKECLVLFRFQEPAYPARTLSDQVLITGWQRQCGGSKSRSGDAATACSVCFANK